MTPRPDDHNFTGARVMAIVDGKPISNLIDTGTTFSALLEFWGPAKPS
jgi:hypothetical protein